MMSEAMTDERLAEIRARNAARTPGEWVMVNEDDSYCMNAYYVVAADDCADANAENEGLGPVVCSTLQQTAAMINGGMVEPKCEKNRTDLIGFDPGYWERNAEFIAHAPDDITALLAEVKRLRAELAKTTSCHRCGTHKMRDATDDYPELCKTCGEYMIAKPWEAEGGE